VALFRRCTWTLLILSVLAFLLSSLTSFVGLFFNFTGTGSEDLANMGMNTAAYTMRAALPVLLVVGALSRRVLAWVYWMLYVIASVGQYILDTANSTAFSEPLRLAAPSPVWSARRAIGSFSSITILYLVLALLAHFMFRVERRSREPLAEIPSDSI
jgi:hypothetical protein